MTASEKDGPHEQRADEDEINDPLTRSDEAEKAPRPSWGDEPSD